MFSFLAKMERLRVSRMDRMELMMLMIKHADVSKLLSNKSSRMEGGLKLKAVL